MPETVRETVLVVERTRSPRDWALTLAAPERAVHAAGSAHEGAELVARYNPDVVLVSLDIADVPGLRVLDLYRERAASSPIVALSASPSVAEAVAVMRHGAVDYLAIDAPEHAFREALIRALKEARSTRALERARDQVREQYGFSRLLTRSPRMLRVFDEIRAVASTDATVLIRGETGTGKELVSRAIHDASRRKDKPFVAVNCGAFTESLLESELFGHERGSFTGAERRREGLFEMANGGTLFLDELGETSLNVQVNLLRVLEDYTFRRIGGRETVTVDVRVVAATNAALERQVREGSFREDLFFRLNVFPIQLPPLRERVEDIPILMRHFLDEIARDYDFEAPTVTSEAQQVILGYHWPGNVRELRAMCERWVITRHGRRLEREHLPPSMAGRPAEITGGGIVIDEHSSMDENTSRVVAQIEKEYLYRLLKRHKGHLEQTATAAGITRRTLYTKMKTYGLEARDFKGT